MPSSKLRYDSGFAPVPYKAMRDRRLSIGARGLLAMLVTHSDGWEFNRKDIIEKSQCTPHVYDKLRRELVQCGYLEIKSFRNANGNFNGSEWVINGCPEGQILEKQDPRSYRNSKKSKSGKQEAISKNNSKDRNEKGKQMQVPSRASAERIGVNSFLRFKGIDFPDEFILPERVSDYLELKLNVSAADVDHIVYCFAEFWMLCIKQKHGKKTYEEWENTLIKYIVRNLGL